MIGNSIYSLLSGHAALTALVGTKIYPVQAPQAVEEPFLVYGISKTQPEETKVNASAEDWVTVLVDVYAKDYDTMHSITREVRAALDKQSGTIAGNSISDIVFQDFNDAWESDRESYTGVSEYLVISTP